MDAWDGGEAEVREARDGAWAAGTDKAPVVVLGVDEGDVEAPRVEDLGQLHHRGGVALRRVRHAHRVGLAVGEHVVAWIVPMEIETLLFWQEIKEIQTYVRYRVSGNTNQCVGSVDRDRITPLLALTIQRTVPLVLRHVKTDD